MRLTTIAWWIGWALLACVGCESSADKQTYPNDPLFMSKKPVEAKADNSPLPSPTRLDLRPPGVPPLVLATRQGYLQQEQIRAKVPPLREEQTLPPP